MRFFPKLVVLLALTFCAALATSAHAKLPGINDPKAPTDRQRREAMFAFCKQTMSGAYLRVGAANADWDADAAQFLADVALFMVNGTALDFSKLPNEKSTDELAKTGADLINAGCDDPMVAFGQGLILLRLDRGAEARNMLGDAVQKMISPDSKYPLCQRVAAVSKYVVVMQGSGQAVDAEIKFLQEQIANLPASPECKGINRRFILFIIKDAMQRQPPEVRKIAYDRLLAHKADEPWTVNLALGAESIKRAWDSRGGGWANTVTDEGWRGFYEQLGLAKKYLTEAYVLEPDYPEAAEHLITVAMGAGDRLNVDAREWFDKAIAAQLDYVPAFDAYYTYLMPRWFGSHAEQMALAHECIEAKRFDTNLPVIYTRLLTQVVGDKGKDVVLVPPVFPEATSLLDELADKTPSRDNVQYYRGLKLAMEFSRRDYDAAKTTLSKLSDNVNARAMKTFDLKPAEVFGKTYAMTGEQKDALSSLERRLLTGGQADVVAELTKIAGALHDAKATDPGVGYVDSKIVEYTFKRDFSKGDWLSIQPDKALTGWTVMSGDWTVDDKGKLVGAAKAGLDTGQWALGPSLTFDANLGERYAVRAHLSGQLWYGGFVFGDLPPQMHGGAWLGRRNETIDVGNSWKRDSFALVPKPVGQDILIEVWDRKMWVTVDGKRVATAVDFKAGEKLPLSINVRSNKAGFVLEVTDLAAKQLGAEPK